MARQYCDDKAPPRHLLLREGAALALRIYNGFGSAGERGDPEAPPLMVIPGFCATDRSTLGLQRAMAKEGYRVAGWGLGWNLGARADTLDRIEARLENFGRGQPVTLIGWSLGGIYAREVAKQRPDLVSRVMTLGSPFAGDPRSNNAWRLYELISRHPVDCPPLNVDLGAKPPVPTIALWSKRDGVVAPLCARGFEDQTDRHVELDCSHMGFATSRRAFRRIAAILRED
ncbi:MAG TPA: alpha/beta hydrolase [Allosphingosinicella sp.]|jgi:pimeloyl-ACP methyl ester carboxylesterase